jgi:uncharacterized protein (DUF2062 family)
MADFPATLARPTGALAASAAAARRSFWQRRIVDPLGAQLTRGITPEKIALSLAVGSLCAFFPVLGAATPLCFLAGLALRLNQPVIQIVNCATIPLYPLAVLAWFRLGNVFLGAPGVQFGGRVATASFWSDPARFVHDVAAFAGHAVLGWAVAAPLWVGAGYFSLLPVIRAVAAARGGRARARVPQP